MAVFIGTSGWQYRHWKDRFYPQGLRSTDELQYYADRFRIVEVNNTFYKLPGPEVFESWAKQTPEDFIFGLKASQYLTSSAPLEEEVTVG